MTTGRCYQFRHAIARLPGQSCTRGIRAHGQRDPDPALFEREHRAYVQALEQAGVTVTVLPPLEAFPDAVFVEDAALCMGDTALVLRPGNATRLGEADALEPDLVAMFSTTVALPGTGTVDGGDVLLTDKDAFVGVSERTNETGIEALSPLLAGQGYTTHIVRTPPGVLHFKSDCAVLDSHTVFATERLARSGCFNAYDVITAPPGEEAAANLIRVNDRLFMRAGFPATATVLRERGYNVVTLTIDEAAKLDGGLSCMSLRFSLSTATC